MLGDLYSLIVLVEFGSGSIFTELTIKTERSATGRLQQEQMQNGEQSSDCGLASPGVSI